MYTEPIYTEHSVTDRCRRCNTNVRTASEQAKVSVYNLQLSIHVQSQI